MKDRSHPWFTIEEIDPKTYALSEYGHYEEVRSFLLLGRDRAALIDTGTGIGDIASEVAKLTQLPVTVITTHCHWDHIGGHEDFEDIGIHEAERPWLEGEFPVPLGEIRAMVQAELAAEHFSIPAPEDFSIDSYQLYSGTPSRVFRDGDLVELGSRQLQLLHTPGHSPGHVCVFDRSRGFLFTGDLVLAGTLYAFFFGTDPSAYRRSVGRLCEIEDVELLLPSHNSLTLPPSFLFSVKSAFDELRNQNVLHHGTGVHAFDGFAVRL